MTNQKKQVTVKELMEQLKRLEELGMGDYHVWYRDENSMDWRVEEGVFDICKEYNSIALG